MPTPLLRFMLLYGLMYAAFGVASPFLPTLLETRGLAPAQIGLVMGLATGVRLLAAPVAGRIADLLQALRAVLALCALLAALMALGLMSAHGFWLILLISLAHAAALAPITTTADALALTAARRRPPPEGFEYGWVRGIGSAAFILGVLASGQVVGVTGPDAILGLQAALLGAVAVAAIRVPQPGRQEARAVSFRDHRQAMQASISRWISGWRRTPPAGGETASSGVLALLRIATFRRIILVCALVLGSHAMHDTFAMIRWREAGIGPGIAAALWSESVAAEVVMFFVLGPFLMRRLGPAAAATLAAAAGVIRWTTMALTSDIVALALVQPLHGLTFALLHLAAMRLIGDAVPHRLAATAQAVYGTLAVGTATSIITLTSGTLYAQLGGHAFLVMALLCAAAVPLTCALRR